MGLGIFFLSKKTKSLHALTFLTVSVMLMPAGCKKDEPANLPKLSVTTTPITTITPTGAIGGGTVTSVGNAVVTQRGIVWDTNSHPKITLSTKSSDGTGVGSFTSVLNDLSPGTSYFVAAYASSANGTSYGEDVTFTSAVPAPTAIVGSAYATNITAKWYRVSKVSYYELDVSSDNFATLLPAYKSLRVDTSSNYGPFIYNPNPEVSYGLFGLNSDTNYQYRVRAVMQKADGNTFVSASSNIVSICTRPGGGVGILVRPKNIDLARQLIVGTWELCYTTVSIPQYPFPDPNGNTERISSFCKGYRPQYVFNGDFSVTIIRIGSPNLTGVYLIDSALTILGPGNPRELQIRINFNPPITYLPDPFGLLHMDNSGASMDWVRDFWDPGLKYINHSSQSFIKSK